MEKFEKLLPLIATLLTAALGAAGVLLQEWRQRRDDRYRQNRARTEASEMVSFVEKWIAAQKLACSPEEFEQAKQTARLQLERVYSSLLNVQEAKKPVEDNSFLQRLLLLYKPASLGAWGLHLLFYFLVIIVLLWVALSVSLLRESRGDLTPSSLVIEIVMLFIVSLILLVPTLAIRAWAIAVHRKHLSPGRVSVCFTSASLTE